MLVLLGLVLIVLNLAGIGPVGQWNWEFTGDLWKFATPFVLAAVWWAWADGTGLTKRREMEKMDERKRERREKNLVSLGMDKMAKRVRKAGK